MIILCVIVGYSQQKQKSSKREGFVNKEQLNKCKVIRQHFESNAH